MCDAISPTFKLIITILLDVNNTAKKNKKIQQNSEMSSLIWLKASILSNNVLNIQFLQNNKTLQWKFEQWDCLDVYQNPSTLTSWLSDILFHQQYWIKITVSSRFFTGQYVSNYNPLSNNQPR